MSKNQTTTTDDQLVAMHKKARKRKKRNKIITIVVIIAVVLCTVILGVTVLRKKITEQVASDNSEVESAQVTVGNISTTVSGSGTLAAEDVETLEMLSSLEIADYYVEEGDSVKEGDLVATVTNASLLSAMSEKQQELDDIDKQLEEVSDDEVSDTITTSLAGRVKKINVAEGDDIATAMYDSGSLMLLSLDGYMAVEVTSDSLSAGDSVTVKLSDDTTVEGEVEKQVSGTATILVTDNGTTYGDTVTVYDSDNNEVGTGSLSIHSQLMITGYAGTVSDINVSENESVSAGDTLLELTDTETSASYDALLKERAEVEEQLNDLVKIYKEGGVCAGISGVVASIDEATASDTTSTDMNAAQDTSSTGNTTVATISPDKSMAITISVDETDILSLTEGQEASVTIDSIGEDTYEGVVSEISTTASSESGVTSYSAVVTIDKTEDMLSGMSASVVITIEGVDNAMLIPVDALHQTSATAYVYTEYDEATGEFSGMKEVTTGLSNSTYVEITEGISEGDTVYYNEEEEETSFGPGMRGNMGNGGFSGDMPSDGNMPSGGSMPGGSNQNTGSKPSGGGSRGGN